MDTELTWEFIQNTQPDVVIKLQEQHGADQVMNFFARLDGEIKARGILSVLREGITDHGIRIKLAYFKPENNKNPETIADYAGNILSVMRQVKYSVQNENSLDMVIFVNGLPILLFLNIEQIVIQKISF
jgi:type I restriction enzyme R subunit